MDPTIRKAKLGLFILLICVILVLLFHIGIGSYLWISPQEVLFELLHGNQEKDGLLYTIIWEIRLPRALGCILGGGLLGGVGSVFQALFRNPLADPYVLGVSSGAAMGGTLSVVLGYSSAFGGLGMVATALLTGMISLGIAMGISRQHGFLSIPTLLLAGIVIGSFQSGMITTFLLLAGEDFNHVFRWLMGSTTPMFWNHLGMMAATLVIGGILLLYQTRALNVFSVGESSAKRLGVSVNRVKGIVLIVGTAMTAVVVGCMGILGFIGLVAPHIARRILKVDLRFSFVGSILVGSLLLLGADLIAQRLFSPIELPVGVVTTLLGAPVLIRLLRRKDVTSLS